MTVRGGLLAFFLVTCGAALAGEPITEKDSTCLPGSSCLDNTSKAKAAPVDQSASKTTDEKEMCEPARWSGLAGTLKQSGLQK
ncbi:MAG: hypothetical protein KDJ74_17670 [Notoacmeibacter sp.]|nr:hypothetical protein [Notoacmeibacter sp.]